nr:hypothetical protein BaRGS_033193 [Batillaria attramentaria]
MTPTLVCIGPQHFGRQMDRDTLVRVPAEASGIFPTQVGSYPERVRYGPNGEAVATQPSFTHFTGHEYAG